MSENIFGAARHAIQNAGREPVEVIQGKNRENYVAVVVFLEARERGDLKKECT